VTPSKIEPATFELIAQCLNQQKKEQVQKEKGYRKGPLPFKINLFETHKIFPKEE
jgi:hypothetical protein